MSKELEALENIKHYDSRVGLHEDDYAIIETTLKRLDDLQQMLYKMNVKHGYEEYLKISKALEIIKEKRVDVLSILCGACKTCEEYNEHHSSKEDIQNGIKPLTQEEHELLKEVLL